MTQENKEFVPAVLVVQKGTTVQFPVVEAGEVLGAGGLVVTTRKTRGEEIDAACGQLAGKIHDRTRRPARLEGTGS